MLVPLFLLHPVPVPRRNWSGLSIRSPRFSRSACTRYRDPQILKPHVVPLSPPAPASACCATLPPEPIHGQSCCTTRHDTNTTKHDTIRHEHGWTRLPFVSCRVRRRAKTSTRTRHEGHRVVSCWHDNTTGPPCRVNTNTIHRKKIHQRQFFQVYNIQQHRFKANLHFFVLVVVDDRRQPLVPRRTSHHLRKDQRAKEEVH
jgi:hypothetical protein